MFEELLAGPFEELWARADSVLLAATPSERLRWLEEALAFAARMGALRDKK